ncbi:DUF3742 family protein [Pseudomonas tolaasii]|uniref:DUF3742 family protein n=3 Tax=Pseudomonas tolaasii TaxID=29442 RepID=A0A7Y8DSI7_PSETO|nr:DUF3742 family protein [Pseudomonas tolaasii]ARB31274.1 DUF3742 domain-containing protein [Pseudomonas tolaasii]KAB0466528.1 DUF3742 family protein [Pseudomonas tolaasii]MBY8943484.1 DUF3742 family protein [Pseudomonas tolaasii]NWC23965.1 DUF3742 family protein [Pseudomonas tolaasii]NWC30720.1 DUF3742 family protein [Pseudomonas tolaasii]
MPTQQPVRNSRAHYWAYACGMSVKRGYRRLKTFESCVAERVVTAGIPAGKLLVRGSFLTAKLALVGGLLFIGFWLVASVVVMIAVIALLQSKAVIDTDFEKDNPGPDYLGASSYLGNYDDNGHYIGHFKSSDDVR